MILRTAALSLVLLLAPGSSTAAEEPFHEKAIKQMLGAIQNEKQKEFASLGDERFRTMPETEFKKTTAKFSPLLKGGYRSTYLGDFKDTSVRVHYWKLEFPGEPHDWLAKMAVGDNTVKGFLIVRP